MRLVKFYKLILCVLMCLSFPLQLNAGEKSSIKISMELEQGIQAYNFLLDKPSLLILAIKNSGFEISQTRPIVISDLNSFSIGPGTIRFLGRKDNLINYEAVLLIKAASIKKNITAHIAIDANKLTSHQLDLTVQSEFLDLIPDSLLSQLKSKLISLLDKKVQFNILNYLDGVAKRISPGNSLSGNSFDSILLIDSYNYLVKYGSNRVDEGEEATLYEQRFLFASILIWTVLISFSFFIIRKRRVKK